MTNSKRKLTDAQQHMVDTLRTHGGSMRRVNFRFVDAAGKPILGLNLVAARSLVKLGLVKYASDECGQTYSLCAMGFDS